VGRQALDLAHEIGRGEPALTELAGQRVGGGGECNARVDELAEQGGDQDGVAGVVELELVDAQQPVAGQGLDGLLEPEGADEVGQLHERAERLAGGLGRGGVPQGRQQVGLADAVTAVEVDAARAGRGRLPGRPAESEQPPLAGTARLLAETRREALQDLDGLRLAGLVRVRYVRAEAHRVEPRRRHHLGDQPVRGNARLTGAQGQRGRVGHGAGSGGGRGGGHGSPC
jgi:hypothetical protein